MMPQRYDKYKIKAILLFSIIICLFATRFIYYSTLLKHVEDKADFDFLFKEYYPQLYYYAFHLINNMEASKNTHEQYVQIYSELTKSYVETEYQEQDERMMHISKAMEKLTPHTRHILEECYIQRKKYQEVAEELNISVSAVRKHIVKALQVIREECAKKS